MSQVLVYNPLSPLSHPCFGETHRVDPGCLHSDFLLTLLLKFIQAVGMIVSYYTVFGKYLSVC